MPLANLEHAQIDYLDEGEGDVILLVHGFASTKQVNWVETGWVKMLVEANYRVIAHDNRGHGNSQKFYNESDYSLQKMAGDSAALLDYLGISKANIMGYSMGARICTALALSHKQKLERIILAGNGYNMITSTSDEWLNVRDALLAPDLKDVNDQNGRRFRAFADQTGSDRKALAACVIGAREQFSEDDFRSINQSVMVAIGTKDEVADSGQQLADLMLNGSYLPILDRDHMRAVGDKNFMAAVLNFLSGEGVAS